MPIPSFKSDGSIQLCKTQTDIENEYNSKIASARDEYLNKSIAFVRFPEVIEAARKAYEDLVVAMNDEIAYWSGVYNGTPIVTSLEDRKARKWFEIKKARDAAEQSYFSYLGKEFDSDLMSVTRLNSAANNAVLAMQAGVPFKIGWTLRDNTSMELDAMQMLECLAALAIHSDRCHRKSRIIKEYINTATDLAQLHSICWEAYDSDGNPIQEVGNQYEHNN